MNLLALRFSCAVSPVRTERDSLRNFIVVILHHCVSTSIGSLHKLQSGSALHAQRAFLKTRRALTLLDPLQPAQPLRHVCASAFLKIRTQRPAHTVASCCVKCLLHLSKQVVSVIVPCLVATDAGWWLTISSATITKTQFVYVVQARRCAGAM